MLSSQPTISCGFLYRTNPNFSSVASFSRLSWRRRSDRSLWPLIIAMRNSLLTWWVRSDYSFYETVSQNTYTKNKILTLKGKVRKRSLTKNRVNSSHFMYSLLSTLSFPLPILLLPFIPLFLDMVRFLPFRSYILFTACCPVSLLFICLTSYTR